MKVGNRHKMLAGMAVLWLLLGRCISYAAGNMAVVETCTGESEIMLYLKGAAGDISDIQVQAGTMACEDLTLSRLSEGGLPVKTLIMLDNSLSIPKAERKHILEMIQHIVSERMENEEMAVAVFHEGIEYLTDYTSDDQALADAASRIEFQSSNTYLTDVLYELLSAQAAENEEEAFRRMIVISDGMDNKSIGYTKDELYALLREHAIPIYTVGAQTKKKDNNNQLENMFAISRMTNAESFLLRETEDFQEIYEAVSQDQEIVRITVRPPEELLDGSRKTIKVMLDSGESISSEAVMPQKVKDVVPETDQKETAGQTDNTELEEGTEEQESAGNGHPAMLLIPVCLLAAAAVWLITKKQKKHKKHKKLQDMPAGPEDEKTDLIEDHLLDNDELTDDERTVLMDETEVMDDENTVVMWDTDDERSYNLILTDVRIPARSFQAPLQNSVVIGRKQGMCNIVIDQDMSISGQHCKIMQRDGRFYILDLQSSNGTYVDGCRILSETEILPSEVIKMGKSEFRFEVQ